jgi:hypothetical protein
VNKEKNKCPENTKSTELNSKRTNNPINKWAIAQKKYTWPINT